MGYKAQLMSFQTGLLLSKTLVIEFGIPWPLLEIPGNGTINSTKSHFLHLLERQKSFEGAVRTVVEPSRNLVLNTRDTVANLFTNLGRSIRWLFRTDVPVSDFSFDKLAYKKPTWKNWMSKLAFWKKPNPNPNPNPNPPLPPPPPPTP